METLKAVLFLVSICSCWAAFSYTACGSHGIIHSISLEPCELHHDGKSCIIRRNHTYTSHINFTATESSTTLSNVCHGIIDNVPVPFAVTPKDACGNGVVCPLQPGQAEVYTASVQCPDYVKPGLRMLGKWEVVDQNGLDLICFVFPLVIQ